jgi:hypothetical protein
MTMTHEIATTHCHTSGTVPSPITPPSAGPSRGRILTVAEVALELRCSKAHVYNVIAAKVDGVRALPAISMSRRKLVRRTPLCPTASSSAFVPRHRVRFLELNHSICKIQFRATPVGLQPGSFCGRETTKYEKRTR